MVKQRTCVICSSSEFLKLWILVQSVNITLPQSKFFQRTILYLNCCDFKFSGTVVINSEQHSRLHFPGVYDFVRLYSTLIIQQHRTHTTSRNNTVVVYLIFHINKKLCVSNIDEVQTIEHAHIAGTTSTTSNTHFETHLHSILATSLPSTRHNKHCNATKYQNILRTVTNRAHHHTVDYDATRGEIYDANSRTSNMYCDKRAQD
jgi:hypothetical protein